MTNPGYHMLKRSLEADEWKIDGLCHGRGDLFFPEHNSDNRTGGLLPSERMAKSLCVRCPVRQECMEAGMKEEWGIWAGTTKEERIRFRRAGLSIEDILDKMDSQAVVHGLAPAKATNGGRV